jgi:hypothetical protein
MIETTIKTINSIHLGTLKQATIAAKTEPAARQVKKKNDEDEINISKIIRVVAITSHLIQIILPSNV